MKRYSMLDFLKGITCILVVFIHVVFPGKLGEVIKLLSAYAVPFFYMVAGYFAYGKNETVIKRRLCKIAKITFFAYIVFFLLGVYGAVRADDLAFWISNNFSIVEIAKYIIFCTINFAIPLWYLLAQIETYIFWIFVVKFKKEDLIVKLMPMLFLAQIISITYCDSMGMSWFWKINFVTRSLSWFTLGYYINSISLERINRIRNKNLFMSMVIGALIILAPSIFDLRIKFNCVGYIPLALAIFVIALKYADTKVSDKIEYIGLRLSLWVYIFHSPLATILDYFLKDCFNIDTVSVVYKCVRPIVTVILSLLLAQGIEFMSGKIKNMHQ